MPPLPRLPRSFALTLLAPLALATAAPAAAGVRVEVDPGAPFTEPDLAGAVELRLGESATVAAGDIVVRVAKLGLNQLIVTVGERTQLVELPDRDRAATSRVVAQIVTGMLEAPAAAAQRDAEPPPPLPPTADGTVQPAPAPRRHAVHAGLSYGRDDNGYWVTLLNGGASWALAPSARLIATIGVGRNDAYLDTASLLVPVRVGIEGRAGATGIELGGHRLGYREDTCGEWGAATGVYGAAKVFLPLGARARLVGELGGHFVVSNDPTTCNSASNYTSYGGWMGANLEWAR